MIKANKGEWSEFYAFLKILIDRKIFAADADLNAVPDKYFDVLKIIREELSIEKVYDISTPDRIVVSIGDEKENNIIQIDPSKLKKRVRELFEEIKRGKGRSFEIITVNKILEDLRCVQFKAASNRKADIVLVVHDRIASTYPQLGFSIKSRIGQPSTLLNASGATNFIYKIDSTKTKPNEPLQKIREKAETIADRMEKIGYGIHQRSFVGIQNKKFEANLRKVDTVLPEILAEVVKTYYTKPARTLSELVDRMSEVTFLKEQYGLNKKDYIYKIKKFLVAIALGMTPAKEWDGLTAAHGGYIIVKEDGEVLCYHLYNRDEFEEYLFRNTKLETPSPSRHRFGKPYQENGELYIKLNLQIRFVR